MRGTGQALLEAMNDLSGPAGDAQDSLAAVADLAGGAVASVGYIPAGPGVLGSGFSACSSEAALAAPDSAGVPI